MRVIPTILLAAALFPAVDGHAKTKLPAPPARPALPAAASPAAPAMDIAAVVGGHAITSYDLDNRMRFILATAQLSDTPETIERLRPQVIRSLIDEQLQMEEAEKNDIKVEDGEVQAAIADIERSRGMQAGEIRRMLESNRIPPETFTSQIHTQIAWSHLLSRKIRPQVKISDAEIELGMRRFGSPAASGAQNTELQIAVLTLPVDKPAREAELKKLADKLVGEMRGGASFEEVSRQFSSAGEGGKPETFWVRAEHLDPELARSLKGAAAGTITSPVRTSSGFSIVKVYAARAAQDGPSQQMQVTLKQILLKLKPDADVKEADVLLQIGEEVARHPGACEDKGLASIDKLEDFDIDVTFRQASLSELSPALRLIAESLKVGDISTPFASFEGIRLYMLCAREEVEAKPVAREQVANLLLRQKMELEAQKYLRNLRREAFVDLRS